MAKTKVTSKYVDRAALFLISRAQRPITLEIEVARKVIPKFIKDYSEWTGKSWTWEKLEDKGFAVDCGTGKWGAECRIYFVKDQTIKTQLLRYGYKVENGDVRYDGTFRINSNELFKELIEKDGLRLGHNS
jgi:hypothetical protein